MRLTEEQKQTLKEAHRILEAVAKYQPEFSFERPQSVKEYFSTRLIDRESEVFCVAFLNTQHQLIETREMFNGTLDGASVYPREVVKAAIEVNAGAVIFAHNHPSGLATPSRADQHITERLKEALGLIDVRTLDHIIVGRECYSFAEHGII